MAPRALAPRRRTGVALMLTALLLGAFASPAMAQQTATITGRATKASAMHGNNPRIDFMARSLFRNRTTVRTRQHTVLTSCT